MKIIPTLIHHVKNTEHRRAVISYSVYRDHPNLYYRNCFDPLLGVAPVAIEDWDDICFVDYKLFQHSYREPDYTINLRRDLDRFLMNRQPVKCLHLSLDDENLKLTPQFLNRQLGNLRWRMELQLQVVDRTATTDPLPVVNMFKQFIKDKPISEAEYHHQLVRGPADSPASLHDLLSDSPCQYYLHDPPHPA